MKKIILHQDLTTFTSGLDLICRNMGLEYCISDTLDFSCINICPVEAVQHMSLQQEFVQTQQAFTDFILNKEVLPRWHCIYKLPQGGFLICGDRKIDVFHALLNALDRYEEDICEFNVSRFNRLYENFDDFYSGFARAADNFNLEIHMIDLVRAGVENFEINTLYDDIPIQVREREHPNDVYPWWCTYSPSLDMFYESNLNKGTYTDKMLRENRSILLHNAELASALGMAPVFTTFEPRVCPERLFKRYPEIRGARVDFDAYSAIPEYGLDPTHPLVLEHFSELIAQLMQDVPNLAIYEIWSQDSNASFPWADCSYMKRNGPTRLYEEEFHNIVNPLLVKLQETVCQYNPDTKVNINLDWVFSLREKEEIAKHLPDGVGLTFGFLTLVNNQTVYENILKEKDCGQIQYIYENVAHAWKRYAPLVGFPFPRSTYKMLRDVQEHHVQNLTLRGGLCTRTFVPNYINNEIVRNMKYNRIENIDAYLMEQAKRFTSNEFEAKILYDVWELCDKFNADYQNCRVNSAKSEKLHWTTSMFVSPRTLFRKLVWPIVPNLLSLTFQETRYYRPQMFYTHDSDPSWNDMSYFNFKQMVSDSMMEYAYKNCEAILIPYLEKAVALLNTLGDNISDYLRDIRDRIECMLCITRTEKSQMKVQCLTHYYLNTEDAEARTNYRNDMHKEMLAELENVEQFIKLLDTSSSILIPTTSGEETTYMYKAPMSQHLKCKLKIMKAHMNDEPGGYTS